jgi:hypothetical protein
MVDTARNENLLGRFRRAQNRRRNPGLPPFLKIDPSVEGMDMFQGSRDPNGCVRQCGGRRHFTPQSLSRLTGSSVPLARRRHGPGHDRVILIGTAAPEYRPALKVAIGHFRWRAGSGPADARAIRSPQAKEAAAYSRAGSSRLCSMA